MATRHLLQSTRGAAGYTAVVSDTQLRRVLRVTSFEADRQDRPRLEYWLSRPPEERVSAVEFLRQQVEGGTDRMQRVIRVVRCPWG